MAAIEFPYSRPYNIKNNANYPGSSSPLKARTSCNKISFPTLTKTFTLSKSLSHHLFPVSNIYQKKVEPSNFSPFDASQSLKLSRKGCSTSICGEEVKLDGVSFNTGAHTIAMYKFKDATVKAAKDIDQIQGEGVGIDYLNTGVDLEMDSYPTSAIAPLPRNLIINGFFRDGTNEVAMHIAQGFGIGYLNTGVGLKIDCSHTSTLVPTTMGLVDTVRKLFSSQNLDLISDNGCIVIANSYCLAQRNDDKRLVVIDGSMTELIYPSLSDIYQDFEPVHLTEPDVVCTTIDVGFSKCISNSIKGSELNGLVFHDAGTYCESMAATSNHRIPSTEYHMVEEDGLV